MVKHSTNIIKTNNHISH